ncbi:MAG: coproporphyrinogen dehydrogenase HemZ [Clostridiales bacterium]|nr:coproporphyrinogen dehydrogenase HemZ [Roseburia sp.]MDD7637487.1 coproporphyrinogen dehydrogenase HemZ [Clostridiales bacterium]MDY4113963.1 coproporphyrinogen dehydrogenase HemZ [Roseburia sp.]
MIIVKLNAPEFEYDIHSLVKAFYPKQDVSVTAEEKAYDERCIWTMQLDYLKDTICIRWWENEYDTVDETALIPKQSVELPGREFKVDFSNRAETKNLLKQNLYQMLAAYTGKGLPWGTLTGIRPTKIPMKFLEEGKSRDEIVSYMKETYFASDEKIHLATDIAERELALLSKIDYENGYSLYIGIPFCPTTCLYCSFTSYPLVSWAKRVDEYLDALEKEIDFVAVKFAKKHLNSIYIGGGTPTTLEPYQLDRLIRKIKCSFDLSDCIEFTVEAGRPDSITREKLEILRKHGISRISINPQTMKDETLKLIGRHHTVAQTIESFELARKIGFDNINMDLIMGLPGEDIEDVRQTMEELKKLNPDNITVHSLALKRAARLNMFKEDYKDYKMVNTQEHMDLTAAYAKEMGLSPYYLYRQKSMAGNLENVGYAAPGKAGVYNILIMEEKQTIMALGAGATTKFVIPQEPNENHEMKEAYPVRIERVENVKDVENYLARVDEMIERKIAKMEEISWH